MARDTHFCVASSVADAPHSVPRQAASLPRLNASSQRRFAGKRRVRKPPDQVRGIREERDAHHWFGVQREPFDLLQGLLGDIRRFERDERLSAHAEVVVRDNVDYLTVRLEETAQG